MPAEFKSKALRRTAPRTLRPSLLPLMAKASDATTPAFEEPVLAVNDIQGNVLPGFNTKCLFLLGFRIRMEELETARLWLRDLAPLVTTLADAWHAREVVRAVAKASGVRTFREGVFLNVALSFDALGLLGLSTSGIPDGPFKVACHRQIFRMPWILLACPSDGRSEP